MNYHILILFAYDNDTERMCVTLHCVELTVKLNFLIKLSFLLTFFVKQVLHVMSV